MNKVPDPSALPLNRRIDEIGRGANGFGQALRQARAYAALDRRLAEHLPQALRHRIGIACVREDCLVIAASEPAAATRARLIAPELLKHAARQWPTPLKHWRVVVVPGIEFERDG